MARRGNKNVLYKNMMKKLGSKKGGGLSDKECTVRMTLCMRKNTNTDTAKQEWKTKVRRMLAVEYSNWINTLQAEAVSDMLRRMKLNIGKYVAEKGSGTAYLMNMRSRPAAIRSITHTNSTLQRGLKVPMRRLKAGLICRMQILKHMMNNSWGSYSFDERLDHIMCPCGLGLQDVKHLVEECSAMESTMLKAGEGLVKAAAKVSASCEERMRSLSVTQRVITVLHMTWAGREKDKQRRMVQECAKVIKKMMGEIEDRLEQGSVTWILA
jgi:hypothetical protein